MSEIRYSNEQLEVIGANLNVLNNAVWHYFLPSIGNEGDIVNPRLAFDSIISDIEELRLEGHSKEEIKKVIDDVIEDKDLVTLENTLKSFINWDKIEDNVSVRNDFESAFSQCDRGSELSSILGYKLSFRDLDSLARLYISDKYRPMILSLLEDINYHEEYAEFKSGKCAKYIKSCC